MGLLHLLLLPVCVKISACGTPSENLQATFFFYSTSFSKSYTKRPRDTPGYLVGYTFRVDVMVLIIRAWPRGHACEVA